MNVLIIGLGSIAKKHVDAIRHISLDAIIYAFRSSSNSENYPGIINVYSFNDLPGKPDFVIISNPTEFHGNAISEAIVLGCPLFIEKPVLSNLSLAPGISESIDRARILTYVACNMRFHPVIIFLKKWLEKENHIINEVNIYCGSYLPEWRPGKDFKKIYSANPDMGGGVHLDLIHELDYAQWLFGQPCNVRSLKRNVSDLSIDSFDFAFYHFLYKKFAVNISLNYYRRDAKREIEIVTDKDTLLANLLTNTVYYKISGERIFSCDISMQKTYYDQMTFFIDHIKNGRQPMNSFKEGVATLKLALHE